MRKKDQSLTSTTARIVAGTTQPSSSPVQRLVENAFTAASQTISKKCVVPNTQADIQALDKVLTSLVVSGQNAGIMSMKSLRNFPSNKTRMIYLIDAVTESSKSRHKQDIYCTMEINGKQVELKIDTGAKCNVITLDLFKSLSGGEEIDQSRALQLIAYGGDTLSTLGTENFECNLKSRHRNLEFHVVNRQVTPLLGLVDSLSLNLIQLHIEVHEVDTVDAFRAALLDEYKDLFEGDLGNLPVIYKMRLDPDATPVVRPPRKVPIAMEESVKGELDRMVKIGAITPVSEPTKWVS